MKNQHDDEGISLNILRHIEDLSEEINKKMALNTNPVLRRYRLTFGLLVVFGVVAVSEGAKGLLEESGLFVGHPLYLLITGLGILIITGSLYKKLDK
jgi:hypothetical protein